MLPLYGMKKGSRSCPRVRPLLAQTDPSQELAELRFFSVKKNQADKAIEFRITVREYAPRNQLLMRFYAEADKQTIRKLLRIRLRVGVPRYFGLLATV